MRYIILLLLFPLGVFGQSIDNLDNLNGFWGFKFGTSSSVYASKVGSGRIDSQMPYIKQAGIDLRKNPNLSSKYNIDGVVPFGFSLFFYKDKLQSILIMFSLNKDKARIAKDAGMHDESGVILLELKKLFGPYTNAIEEEKIGMFGNHKLVMTWAGKKVTLVYDFILDGLLDTPENYACTISIEDNNLTNLRNLEKYK
jgi:hypothetical protein